MDVTGKALLEVAFVAYILLHIHAVSFILHITTYEPGELIYSIKNNKFVRFMNYTLFIIFPVYFMLLKYYDNKQKKNLIIKKKKELEKIRKQNELDEQIINKTP